jgi:hypothetical protein
MENIFQRPPIFMRLTMLTRDKISLLRAASLRTARETAHGLNNRKQRGCVEAGILRSAFHFDRAFWVFFEALREGPDFTLYCGRQYDNPSPVLAVGLAAEHSSPQGLLADGKGHIRFDSI